MIEVLYQSPRAIVIRCGKRTEYIAEYHGRMFQTDVTYHGTCSVISGPDDLPDMGEVGVALMMRALAKVGQV